MSWAAIHLFVLLLQGVGAAALAGAGVSKELPEVVARAGEDGILHAAFKQERKQQTDADDPEMYVKMKLNYFCVLILLMTNMRYTWGLNLLWNVFGILWNILICV